METTCIDFGRIFFQLSLRIIALSPNLMLHSCEHKSSTKGQAVINLVERNARWNMEVSVSGPQPSCTIICWQLFSLCCSYHKHGCVRAAVLHLAKTNPRGWVHQGNMSSNGSSSCKAPFISTSNFCALVFGVPVALWGRSDVTEW